MNSVSLIIAGLVGLAGGFAYFYSLWCSTRNYAEKNDSLWALMLAAGVRLAIIGGVVMGGLMLGMGAAEMAVALLGFILARQISLIRIRRVQASPHEGPHREAPADAD